MMSTGRIEMTRRFTLAALSLLVATAAFGAVQDLDEMHRRAARRKTNTWPREKLERDGGDYAWQSETLCFTDTKTGHEVWRMTDTPDLRNYYHNDIAMSPWSADGRRLGLQSWRRNRVIAGRELRNLWMVVGPMGERMRPTINNNAYMHWSPLLPETYYTPGGSRMKGASRKRHVLYKVTVSDDGPATAAKALVTYPEGQGCSSRKFISSDGRMYVAMPSRNPGSKGQEYEMFFWPTRIYPEDKAGPLIDKPYSVDRDFGGYLKKPYAKGRYHDAYLLGDGSYYFAIDKMLGYWRIKTVGSAKDGGAKGVGTELIPADARKGGKLSGGWPALEDHKKATREKFFLGHPGFDRWGEMVCYADYDTQDKDGKWSMGATVYDFINHKPMSGKWVAQTDGSVHCDWEAFADWCVVSIYKGRHAKGVDRIECFPYDKIGENFIVCYTNNTRHGKVGSYYNHTRPAQSPDGTKVAWHSSFLNGTNVPDPYWAVCYKPNPPAGLQIAKKGGRNILTWKMPSYTRRGWPKKGDPVPPAREIRRFHIWQADSAAGPWKEIGAMAPEYKVDDAHSVMVPEKLEFALRGKGVFAVTSEEWSGLESEELSDIVDSSGKVVEEAGTKGFWKKAPAAPAGLAVKNGQVIGHFERSWREPKDDKVRYYNLYYSTAGPPSAEQKNRIASLPLGTTKHLDWLADPEAKSAYYAITAVDRHGNESAPVAASTKQSHAAATRGQGNNF